MQKVIRRQEIGQYQEVMDPSVIRYIQEGQVETYEGFDRYDLVAFDWYDLENAEADPSQILIYFSARDLLVICEDEHALAAAGRLFEPADSNEHCLYLFFRNLLKGGTARLERMEGSVSDLEDDITDGIEDGLRERIIAMRNAVLHIKQFYEQIEFLLDEICDDDAGLIQAEHRKYFEHLHSRVIRLMAESENLKEYLIQVRDSYQSQMAIEQNDVMKVFTMVTSIFMPLTLIVSWYGMNLRMPEFAWENGYLFVFLLCGLVSLIWVIIFKRKKWL